jgi:hypothetical protein
MPVYLPQPECEVDPHSGLRRSGILAGHQAFIEGVFPVVAHRSGGIETLRAHQAQLLLAAGNPETEAAPVWRPVSP